MRKTMLAVLVAATAASLTPGVAASVTDTVRWGKCPAEAAGAGLECATIDVPLDYRKPDGKTIEIAISRLASGNPDKRRGVLLTNSGGPGGVGLAFPSALAKLGLPKSVLERYDVIGIDPRGVGRSTPVTCDLDAAKYPTNIPQHARNSAEVAKRATEMKAVANQCGSGKSAELLPHITTANTARDLDRVRQALGEPKVSYFGHSYGTYLGAVYTTLFPHRSDRIVLDSAVGPNGWDVNHSRLLGRGVQDRFPDFAKFAAARPEYGLGRTPLQVRAKYFELAARLDAKPSKEGIDGKLFRQLTFSTLYYDNELPRLAESWQALDTGKPLPQPPAGGGTPEQNVSGAAAPPKDNYLASQLHVLCNDSNWPESVDTYQRNVAIDRLRHPLFGAAAANITPCAYWPSEQIEPAVRITDNGPSNVLIMQNLRDPATPLVGARKLRNALGDRARMITADQGGHLGYLFVDNPCADDRITRFLVTGQRPRHDVACGAPRG